MSSYKLVVLTKAVSLTSGLAISGTEIMPARVLTDIEHRKSLGVGRSRRRSKDSYGKEPLVAKRLAKCDVNVDVHIDIDVLDEPIGQDWLG